MEVYGRIVLTVSSSRDDVLSDVQELLAMNQHMTYFEEFLSLQQAGSYNLGNTNRTCTGGTSNVSSLAICQGLFGLDVRP